MVVGMSGRYGRWQVAAAWVGYGDGLCGFGRVTAPQVACVVVRLW